MGSRQDIEPTMTKACVLVFFAALVTISQANLVNRQPVTRSNVDDEYVLYQPQTQSYYADTPSWQALGQSSAVPVVNTEQRFGYGGASAAAAAAAHAGGGGAGYVGGHIGGHVGGHVGGHIGGHVGGHVNAAAAAAAAASAGGYGGGYGSRYSNGYANANANANAYGYGR